jgi:7,8-dihydroneopterin aldolase/epimerase/oxygenase
MTEVRILQRGIRASGRHGANPGERSVAQEFVVDLDVVVEVGDDRLEGTANYRTLAETAREVVEAESFQLLEHLAGAVATAICRIDRVRTVRAVVHKPSAAGGLGITDVAAEATAGTV